MDGLFGEKNERAKRKSNHPHKELFEALCLACGLEWKDFTRRERGKVQKAAAELFEVGATPEQIRLRAGEYRRAFPGAVMTPCAISGQWSFLGSRMNGTVKAKEALSERARRCREIGHTFADDTTATCESCGVWVEQQAVKVCEKYQHQFVKGGRGCYRCGAVRESAG